MAILAMATPTASYAQFDGVETFNNSKPVTITVITGVTLPSTGKTPVTSIENAQYTGTVTWSPAVSEKFEPRTQYTATITLTAKDGYTLEGVTGKSFRVRGATATINESSSVVIAAFPSTFDSNNDKKLNTLGASINMPFPNSPFILSAHGTYAPFNNSFFELGMDVSWKNYNDNDYNNAYDNIEIFSMYPFLNYAFFVPFKQTHLETRDGGWYAGAGFGVMIGEYTFDGTLSVWDTVFAINIVTGFNLGFFDISYTLRTDFNNINGKLMVGYVYRFK